jgi:5-methylcytosine-specific restriction endonuclease McrA
MTRRPFATLVALLVLWPVLTALWLGWLAVLVLAYCAASTKRGRRKVMRALPRFPSPWRIRDRIPGRRRQADQGYPAPRRMTSTQRAARVALLADRDGLVCQECGCDLDPTAHHRADEHPEVHHLVAWSHCAHEWWADHPVNLVLLCQPCHAPLGADGTTPRLRAKRRELLAWYGYEEAA